MLFEVHSVLKVIFELEVTASFKKKSITLSFSLLLLKLAFQVEALKIIIATLQVFSSNESPQSGYNSDSED